MFFTKGVGKHREKLTSFELALRSAGIAACNLVRVSSIFPPKCRILSRSQGMKRLEPGQVTFVVMSEAATREPHRLIAATVGVAIPRDRELYGYLSEHHSFGESEDIAGDYAEELAAEMLATTLGLVLRSDDLIRQPVDFLLFVPALVRIELEAERRRQHFGSELLGVIARDVLALAEAVVLGQVAVQVAVTRDCHADGRRDEAMRLARGGFGHDHEGDLARLETLHPLPAREDPEVGREDAR